MVEVMKLECLGKLPLTSSNIFSCQLFLEAITSKIMLTALVSLSMLMSLLSQSSGLLGDDSCEAA